MTKNIISELVCTRLSHDIAGSIGAVANAVELLEEGDLDFLDDIKSVLKTSSQNLAARMKFFRMAFGLDNALLDDAALVTQTAQNYLATLGNKDYPISLSLQVSAASGRKTALLMIMAAADLLIRGGRINVFENGGQLVAEIAADGKIPEEKYAKMQHAVTGATPADADAAFVPLYALAESGHKPCFYRSENIIQLVTE